jgi:surface protein
MFDGAIKFNQPLDGWDVSSVENMNYMFDGSIKFNQPLDGWDVSSVNDMSGMFYGAKSFNQPIGCYETTVEEDSFIEIKTGKEVDINSYNLTDLSYKSLSKHGLSLEKKFRVVYNKGWDVGYVTNMDWMFDGAIKFNQDINSWNIKSVLSMNKIFYETRSFKQYLGDWKFDPRCEKPYVNELSFDLHNNVYQYTKKRLMLYINKYKASLNNDSLDLEKNKYELMKYMKQYSQYNYNKFESVINELKNQNIDINESLVGLNVK